MFLSKVGKVAVLIFLFFFFLHWMKMRQNLGEAVLM